ncbi:DMT family transporter [Sphingomonas donggukensis]|uniref:DMT family transporter n=1 Tax=Sphingomonas donggukensis TaxID=2949093 RepID=A0ABY4TSB4_9SPHN|nr:DMT family transporter [Sphingomonas donggukensis]URW75302.1 DMT family transporter [Sphingomonas donggukensis]
MTTAADRILPAIAYRLVSVLAFATMGALIKLAEVRGAGLAELLFFRQAGSLPVIVGWVALGPGLATLRTQRIGAHALRCVVGLSSMTLMFATLLLLPLAEATTLQFTVPIFATILGAVVLREATGRHRWSAVLLGFAGVLVVAQPGSGHIPLLGAATGLGAAFLSASVSILIRRMGSSEPPATIVFYFALLSMVPLVPAFLWTFTAHDAGTWAMLVAIGMVGAVGQLAMTTALSLAPVSVVVPMDYSGLLWATLYGWALFGVLPGAATWAGAPIIVASGLYIVWREQRLARGIARSAPAVSD